ncbi:MAG: hypothetical protein Q8O07_06545, partial [Chloroflexota bacterium]|nr:hypothetical protein [Chloroflexota bacterium]
AASVNNDNLLVPLCSVALLVMVGILRGGASSWRVWALGLICGLAALTKLSALGLLPLAGLVLVLAAWPRRAWRSLFANSAIIGGCVVVLAGWWYVRNQVLYGDPLGWRVSYWL